MIPSFIDKSQIPHKPGIYIYKNETGQIIYVGKAIDLYSRVSSYFNGAPDRPKTAHLVTKIRSLETIIVSSELEALILEANLIKKYLPIYNIALTDDKDYLYIGITRETFPKVVTARKPDLQSYSKYFGPFPSSRTVKETLRKLRRIFPWCSNPIGPKNRIGKACFYYHLKLCPGACVGVISEADYKKNITRFSKFLSGQKEELIKELEQEMFSYSKELNYESAEKIKKIIDGIHYLTQENRVKNYLENPNFLQDEARLGLEELQEQLNLDKIPERIEGYDISNISGTNATGSMVVLTNGQIDKSQYRRFKIKITGRPNDFAMHAEMMGRRLKHDEWQTPDLIIIDGGRGQVRASYSELQKRDINIPILGLAKREEWLYPVDGEIIKLSKKSAALKLLQKLRDESHRFAITYHRKLRSKAFLPNSKKT